MLQGKIRRQAEFAAERLLQFHLAVLKFIHLKTGGGVVQVKILREELFGSGGSNGKGKGMQAHEQAGAGIGGGGSIG